MSLASWYRVGDFFVVRSPLLPVERLLEWCGEGVEARRASLALRLWSAFEEPELREAVFFASPDIHEAMARVPGGAEASVKLQRSLTRYFLRATGRETPFGTLAGYSLGRIAETSQFELAPRAEYRSRTRVSFVYLTRLMGALAARPELRDLVPHHPNTSLSLVQDSYRVARDQLRTKQGETRFSSAVSEVSRSPELDRALELAGDGMSPLELAAAIQRPEIEPAEVLDFCRALCDEQVLVPAWLPPTTGSGATRRCADQLEGNAELEPVRALLADTEAQLAAADREKLGAAADRYRAARARLLECNPQPTLSQPLQTELLKPAARLTLSEDDANRLLASAELLQRLASVFEDPALSAFRKRFVARYDRRLVPLAEAIDADLGVGFDGVATHVSDGLLNDLPLSAPQPTERFDPLDRLRYRLVERALAAGSTVVELDDALLEQFPKRAVNPRSESFAVVARLAREQDGRLLVIAPELTSPSPIALLGRFCEADPALHEAVSRHAAREQELAGDTILADVVFTPRDDTANVVTRPVLRGYEIECGGSSGAPRERRLPISDLWVGVDGDVIDLYSKRLGKRVAIRIANAHNYDQAPLPTLYRFLGALQHQDDGLVSGWTWGALEGSPFLPRVVRGDTVLSLARWELSERELAPLLTAKPEALAVRVRELRAARKLPRWLTRSEGDRRLTVDLENELSVDELLHEARAQRTLTLEELLPAHDQLLLHGPEGHYAAQFVVPFVRRGVLPARPVPRELLDPSLRPARRFHIPGSEWLYARIYAGRSRHAELLSELRATVVGQLLESTAASWFFLPYADPEPHLRLRIRGHAAELRSTALAELSRMIEPLIQRGTVFRFELGTYEPEFERYGGPRGVELAERVFFADSEAACELLELAGDDDTLRWQLTLVGLDRLLSDCGADLAQRASLARLAGEAYGREMGATPATWKAIGEKYRQYSARLSELLRAPAGSDDVVTELRRILDERSARIRPIWREIEQASAAGALAIPIGEELPLSFAHLHAVRMLGVSGRAHELLLYEFLRRHYAALRSTTSPDAHGLELPSS